MSFFLQNNPPYSPYIEAPVPLKEMGASVFKLAWGYLSNAIKFALAAVLGGESYYATSVTYILSIVGHVFNVTFTLVKSQNIYTKSPYLKSVGSRRTPVKIGLVIAILLPSESHTSSLYQAGVFPSNMSLKDILAFFPFACASAMT